MLYRWCIDAWFFHIFPVVKLEPCSKVLGHVCACLSVNMRTSFSTVNLCLSHLARNSTPRIHNGIYTPCAWWHLWLMYWEECLKLSCSEYGPRSTQSGEQENVWMWVCGFVCVWRGVLWVCVQENKVWNLSRSTVENVYMRLWLTPSSMQHLWDRPVELVWIFL